MPPLLRVTRHRRPRQQSHAALSPLTTPPVVSSPTHVIILTPVMESTSQSRERVGTKNRGKIVKMDLTLLHGDLNRAAHASIRPCIWREGGGESARSIPYPCTGRLIAPEVARRE
eukprot:6196102-Pleurochrysis_carterae.AAC.1